MNIARIQKSGKALFVYIPQAYAERLSLNKRDLVSLELTEKGLLVSKLLLPQKGGNKKGET